MNRIMNDFSIRKKLVIIYVFCMLIPMFLTDGAIVYIMLQGEDAREQYQAENIAAAVESYLVNTFDEAVSLSNSVYLNRQINEALEYSYRNSLDFFEKTYGFAETQFPNTTYGGDKLKVVLYADNDTIVNGNSLYRISSLYDTEPYLKLQESPNNSILSFYYQESKINIERQRRISILRCMDYYKDLPSEKVVQIEVNYSYLTRRFNEMKYTAPVYVCSGDTILFSNAGDTELKTDFQTLTGNEKIRLESSVSIIKEPLRILVLETQDSAIVTMQKYFPLLAALLLITVLLPFGMISLINRSFVIRLRKLSQALETIDGEDFPELPDSQGKDEIAVLMRNYNRMGRRIQNLIQTVFKDKLAKQEMDLARQKAELLALHSQIDPHFLFNALESIRMHSVLKQETETASMVEQLAVLERQNVDWSADNIPIREELRFIEAYLNLQKYRFGKRLSYEISLEEGCGDYQIPRLTLVTFVENACVHGVETKAAPCWIYVRIYREKDILLLEIEDTGGGMEEKELQALRRLMEHTGIEDLQKKEHVGVSNACLRLKMSTLEQVSFEVDSEKNVGTFMVIRIPVKALQRINEKGVQKEHESNAGG